MVPIQMRPQGYPQGVYPLPVVSTGHHLALSSLLMMVRNFVYDAGFHHHHPSSRLISRTTNINHGPHHAWHLCSPTPRFHKFQPLGRVGCRRSRTHACRQCLPQALSHLYRTELLTTYGDSRLVTKPSRYHLPGKPKMHFFSPLVSRQLHDGSSNIGVMLWISTSFGRTQQDRRLGRRTPLRCAREMRAS